jgi:RimJ/RimL family protein N-acetyltransferase
MELDGTMETEIGYGFLPEGWGKGYATETACACVAYGKREMDLPSLVALTDPANARSKHVLSKADFRFERTLERGGQSGELFRTLPRQFDPFI